MRKVTTRAVCILGVISTFDRDFTEGKHALCSVVLLGWFDVPRARRTATPRACESPEGPREPPRGRHSPPKGREIYLSETTVA
eukprot:2478679-Prymnesium_polylepis.1